MMSCVDVAQPRHVMQHDVTRSTMKRYPMIWNNPIIRGMIAYTTTEEVTAAVPGPVATRHGTR